MVIYRLLVFALYKACVWEIAVIKYHLPETGAWHVGIGGFQIREKGIVYHTVAEINPHTAAVSENTAMNRSLCEVQIGQITVFKNGIYHINCVKFTVLEKHIAKYTAVQMQCCMLFILNADAVKFHALHIMIHINAFLQTLCHIIWRA